MRSAFLLPGVFGDEPQLVKLREHLADRLTLHTVDLPDLKSPVSMLSSVPETARAVVETMLRLQQDGLMYIVGFSFGASLALEVTTQLQRANHTVAYLGLIDGPFKDTDLRHTFPLTPRGLFSLAKRILQKLNARRILRRARRNLLQGLEVSEAQRHALLLSFRAIALERWEPQRCESEGLIFLSNLLYRRTRETWLSLCPNCKQISIASDHEHVIQGEALGRVAAALAEDIAGVARRLERRTDGTPPDEGRPF